MSIKLIFTTCALLLSTTLVAQRDFTPNSRKQAFGGARDFNDYSFTGLQFQIGPTYTFTRFKNESVDFNNGATRGNSVTDPAGRLGGFAEIGMAHFPKKRSKLSLALKTVLVSHYDWGLGFKYIGGKETTTLNFTDVAGNVIGSEEDNDKFYNGYLYGRFSIYKEVHFKKTKNFYLDNSLGVNVDYRVITADQTTNYHNDYVAPYAGGGYYHKPLVAQLHYGLGFGFRLKRNTFLIPGFRVPIVGFHEWDKANPTLRWFSSKYLPVMFHIKIINLFKKKVKGCNTPGSEEDRKRNEEFLQGS